MIVPSALLALSALSTLVSARPLSSDHVFGQANKNGYKAPLHSLAVDQGIEPVKDGYIVVLKDDANIDLLQTHLALVESAHLTSTLAASPSNSIDDDMGGLKNVYTSDKLLGYAGTFSEDLVDQIREDPMVAFVERDSVVTTMETELGAPWGLARLSHRKTLRLSTFTKYEYDETAGEGVDVYVVDTGININHVEFEGRASWGKTIPKNDVDQDGNGHGSHCAGTIASRKYGVAKKANVIAVKVLGSNGSGSMSDVVDGVLYAATAAAKKKSLSDAELLATGKTAHRGSVASMSLGGGKSPALDKAVNSAVESGLHFAVAAGNDNKDACGYSPAAAEKAVTVGASTLSDERAYFSNHGKCVDIFAPGLNILSTWTGGNTTTNTISGTSMATPHIAGLMAYLVSVYGTPAFNPSLLDSTVSPTGLTTSTYGKALSLMPSYIAAFLPSAEAVAALNTAPVPSKGDKLTPIQMKKALINLSTKNILSGDLPVGTPNLLAFNNYTTSG